MAAMGDASKTRKTRADQLLRVHLHEGQKREEKEEKEKRRAGVGRQNVSSYTVTFGKHIHIMCIPFVFNLYLPLPSLLSG